MAILGADFDTDPQYPWTVEVLADPELINEGDRADWLHDRLMTYLEVTSGPSDEFAREALRRVATEPLHSPSEDPEQMEEFAIAKMQECYPQKWEYVGESALRQLIQRARQVAGELDIGCGEGVLLLTALMYFLGHGITNDPYHPWVGSTLKKETGRDVGSRIERLNTRARSYLARALES